MFAQLKANFAWYLLFRVRFCVLKKTKSKSDDLFTVTETAKSSKPASSKSAKSMDDDLLNLTADIQKINLKGAKTHDAPLIVSESLKSKDIKPVKDSALLKKDLVKKDKVPQQISQDLNNIRTVLEKHGDHDKSLVMSHLTTLTYMKVTVDLLATSKIGLAVNVMRKQTTDQDLANQAKSLLKSWKKMLQAEPVQDQPPAPKPSTEAEVRAYCTKKLLKVSLIHTCNAVILITGYTNSQQQYLFCTIYIYIYIYSTSIYLFVLSLFF